MRRKIEGVPRISREPYWSGYASLSMVLNYWGYPLTQHQLFDHIYGPADERYRYSRGVAVGIGNLALGVQQLTPLRADLWVEESYMALSLKRPELEPADVLRAYISRNIPCIIQTPHHYTVAVGFDTDKDTYILNSTAGREFEQPAQTFEELWFGTDPTMSYDSGYVMLAVRPS